MIYITGDTHGDFLRFGMKHFPEQGTMTKDDYVIICGDFGLWDDSKEERYWLKWLNDKPFTTLFVGGNHENYDLLSRYPVHKWKGGNVQQIQPSVFHLMRGQVFEIDGKRFFTMGGAASHDIDAGILEPDDPAFKEKKKRLDKEHALYRINHVSWWKEELPSEEEYAEARRNLDAYDWKVDYIITHCCPSSMVDLIGGGFYAHDALTDFLDEVKQRCQFDYWLFGHYHDSKAYEKKFILLYEDILQVEPRKD